MKYLFLIFGILFLQFSQAQHMTNPKSQSIELGTVKWHRDYDEAIKKAKEENKALLILFQEVPGCSTCQNYGKNVLSHPLMVEAIENEFISLAIFNNNKGQDAKVLKAFNEPAWNNPVVRIVGLDGKDIVVRVAGNYSADGIFNAMRKALYALGKDIPSYFQFIEAAIQLENNPGIQERNYQMYCFWSGEKHLGDHEGVLMTNPGFMNGHEVVQVHFDENRIAVEKLDEEARKANCKLVEKPGIFQQDKDPQYYLKQSIYKYLPLSATQRSKINVAIALKQNPIELLSPKQKFWLSEIDQGNLEKKVRYDKDFIVVWKDLVNKI